MKQYKPLFLFISFTLSSFFLHAQHPAKLAEPISATDVLAAAKDIQEKAKGNWVEISSMSEPSPYQKRMAEQIRKGRTIVDRVLSRGTSMTDAEAARYDAQMKEVVEQMDAIAGTQNTVKGGQGKCFGGCDGQYKGWGKGKGWNRFWCKVSCFKIEIHVG